MSVSGYVLYKIFLVCFSSDSLGKLALHLRQHTEERELNFELKNLRQHTAEKELNFELNHSLDTKT